MIDVICYGALLPDRVLRLPRFPHPGEGMHALGEQAYLGGEPCNVAGHLARWGVQVAIAGNNLGDDANAHLVKHELTQRRNTQTWLQHDPAMFTPQCYIWVTPDGERTIIPSWPPAPTFTLPPAACIAQTRLVSVSIFGPGLAQMIDLALAHGKPLAMADPAGVHAHGVAAATIITTSRAMLHRRHQVHDVHGWIEHMWQATRALIVVSDSAEPVLVRTLDGDDFSFQPPHIQPVDTTGAGDTLKAVILYGWLHNWPIKHTMATAVAAASQACLVPGPCPRIEFVQPE